MTGLVVPAFLMGLLGGAHCAVMCGGVAAAACAKPCASKSTLPVAASFNVGRVATYAAFGAAAGALGGLTTSFVPLEAVRIGLRFLAAIALVALGLQLAGVLRVFSRIEVATAPIWSRIAPLARRFVPARTPLHAVVLGAVWGFVPRGLVYAATTLAVASESAFGGAAVMLAFGAGTLPLMTVLASAGRGVAHFARRTAVRRIVGAAVLVVGLHQTTIALAASDLSVLGSVRPCCHGAKR